MSQENVEVVRAMYRAWNRGEYSTALESIDDEIEVDAALGQLLERALSRTCWVRKLLEGFWDSFEEHRTDVEECIPVGDDVVVAVHHHVRGKSSERPRGGPRGVSVSDSMPCLATLPRSATRHCQAA